MAFGWSNLYTYLFDDGRFKIIVLQKILGNDLVMSIITRLANHTTLYDLIIQYLARFYDLSYDET